MPPRAERSLVEADGELTCLEQVALARRANHLFLAQLEIIACNGYARVPWWVA